MVSKTIQEPSKENHSPKNTLPDKEPKHFICEQTQQTEPISANSNPIVKNNNFDYTALKMQKKFL